MGIGGGFKALVRSISFDCVRRFWRYNIFWKSDLHFLGVKGGVLHGRGDFCGGIGGGGRRLAGLRCAASELSRVEGSGALELFIFIYFYFLKYFKAG